MVIFFWEILRNEFVINNIYIFFLIKTLLSNSRSSFTCHISSYYFLTVPCIPIFCLPVSQSVRLTVSLSVSVCLSVCLCVTKLFLKRLTVGKTCFIPAMQESKEREAEEGYADVVEKGWMVKEGANDSRRKRSVGPVSGSFFSQWC